jgi:hypothetical protein
MEDRSTRTTALAVAFFTIIASTISLNAGAESKRIHSSICHAAYDNAGNRISNGTKLTNHHTSAYTIYCPVQSHSHLLHSTITTLNVDGYEAPGKSNRSRACVKHLNNAGVACGPFKNWGGGHSGVDAVDVSRWHSYPASFPFLINRIDSSGSLYGFYMTND